MELFEWKHLKRAKHIWIYGAGYYGQQVVEVLSNQILNLVIDGFVVSQKEDDSAVVKGYQVEAINEINTKNEETFFVIATAERYQQEIIETLREYKYHNYLLWDKEMARKSWILADYTFVDRRKGKDKACLILSGYKSFLWNDIFGRLRKFVPEDVDVCILSSGLWDLKLSEIAQENGWSYLNTEFNDITLIQNIAIQLFDQAEWFYKMDEDIFVTRGCFEQLWKTYEFVEKQEPYKTGFVAPLIPVNGYGYIKILKKAGMLAGYEKRFGRALCGGNLKNAIELDGKAAKYMWGAYDELPDLDRINSMVSCDIHTYSVCGVRFSIGFILFHRTLWEKMNGFKVTGKNMDLGVDEIQLCEFCMEQSHAIIVAENTVVGHFSFGPQTKEMQQFYTEHPELFCLNESV